MVGLLRVLDGMAGCAGGISGRAGYVNIGKQSPESMLAAFGRGFEWGKHINRV